MDWIDAGQDVHGLYQHLLGIGSALMRVEDHLTMHIPGAEHELEEAKAKILEMAGRIQNLLDLIQAAGVDDNQPTVNLP